MIESLFDVHDQGVSGVPRYREAKLATHGQNRIVVGQDVADQLADAPLPSNLDQPSHQQITDAAPMPIGTHSYRVFGPLPVGVGEEARDAESGVAVQRNQCHLAVVIDLRQPCGEPMT